MPITSRISLLVSVKIVSHLHKIFKNNNNVNKSNINVLKFLRHLLGITKLDKEKHQCITEKTGAQNTVKKKKTVPKTVATARTEDGHRQNTKTSTAIQTERKEEHRATEEEMEGRDGGTKFIWKIKEQANTPKPSRTSS
jgi:hypothetical protein